MKGVVLKEINFYGCSEFIKGCCNDNMVNYCLNFFSKCSFVYFLCRKRLFNYFVQVRETRDFNNLGKR